MFYFRSTYKWRKNTARGGHGKERLGRTGKTVKSRGFET